MAAQNKMIVKTQMMKEAVIEWFGKHPSVAEVPAKDLADFFVKKGIFETNKNKGSEVGQLLTRLYNNNLIQMLPHAVGVTRGYGTSWYFQRQAGDSMAENGTLKKVRMMEEAVKDWFAENPTETRVPAKKLMDFFVERGIFPTNKYNGGEITQMLNRFNNGNLLHMLPHALSEGKGYGSQWYFQRLASDGPAQSATEIRKYSPEVEAYRSSLLQGYKF